MGFKKVYLSLQELFPQIDARALRAVAIEHQKDVDAAVLAVLEEIIPFFTERSRPSSPLTQSISAGESSEVGDNAKQQPLVDSDDGRSEPFYNAYDGQHEGEDIISGLTLSKTHENKMKMSADTYSQGEPVVLVDKNRVDTLQIEVSGDTLMQEIVLGDICPETGIKIISDSSARQAVKTVQESDMAVSQRMDLVQEKKEIDGHLETNFGPACNEGNDLEKAFADGNGSVDETVSWTLDDITVRPLRSNAQLVEVPDMQESNLDHSNACLLTDNASNPENTSNVVGTEDESSLNAAMCQSSQIHSIDSIDQIIADARNNKKTLFSAMESVISLMRQVELKEQDAEQAKVEAEIGGVDILNKVEELKQMLQYAKEANDMHAGEIHGEKAILATELRELQSRVRSLSDERDKALAVLDEMCQTLEVRLAAAENDIKSAEQEKLEKEKAARKSLADQELVMGKVVQESKILKQHAEENAKLQEFLVDRGRLVDTLQGEIAVICQDVRLLKEKFDQRVPFSRSLLSSQTSFILASSHSSLKSLVPDQVEALPVGDDDLLETQKNGDHEQVPGREPATDDLEGWELFDNRGILE